MLVMVLHSTGGHMLRMGNGNDASFVPGVPRSADGRSAVWPRRRSISGKSRSRTTGARSRRSKCDLRPKADLLGPLLVNLIAYVGQRAQIVGRQLKDHATAEKHVRAARHFHGALAET